MQSAVLALFLKSLLMKHNHNYYMHKDILHLLENS